MYMCYLIIWHTLEYKLQENRNFVIFNIITPMLSTESVTQWMLSLNICLNITQ